MGGDTFKKKKCVHFPKEFKKSLECTNMKMVAQMYDDIHEDARQ